MGRQNYKRDNLIIYFVKELWIWKIKSKLKCENYYLL